MPKRILKDCPKHGRCEHYLRAESVNCYRCVKCRNGYVSANRRKTKERLVELKGGKCERCGYDRCIAALQFHHLDPKKKEFGISGRTKSWQVIQAEASKCVMLCANCHIEEENKGR